MAVDDLAQLVTEQHRADLTDLDLRSTSELVRLMNAEDAAVAPAVAEALPAIARAIDAITERLRTGGRLLYVGAGTAGRLGAVDASECAPTFNLSPDVVQTVIAGGPDALGRSIEGPEDDPIEGARDLATRGVGSRDAVVGISASGRTPFVVGAVRSAKQRGAATVGIACNPRAELSEIVDHPIEVVVGPEVVAGSTRLKAGTAQKMVLNMISTVAMIRLGKTLGNLMVEVQAGNEKLRRRAERIVRIATGSSEHDARAALEAAEGDAKVAIVMLLTATDADDARRLLTRHGGILRNVLDRRTRDQPP